MPPEEVFPLDQDHYGGPAANDALAALARIGNQVRVIEGNVMQVSLPNASVEAVISQEAFLHVPDKARALTEAHRILKPGGRLAFTDWIAHSALSPADAELMWQGMAVTNLYDIAAYRVVIENAGFAVTSVDDLTAEWAETLKVRLAMYIKLRAETQAAGTVSGHDAFYESYVRFVALVSEGALGGGRYSAVKPP